MADSSDNALLITVAICTWNRSALLAATLEQLTALRIPGDLAWELLVINNNCTDDTDVVLERFANRLPLRRVFESRLGQSNARNAGVAAARGQHLVWTDDDVLVDPGWLIAYRDAFAKWPDDAIFGGPIEPWFEGTPPGWLSGNFAVVAGAYATLDLGSDVRALDHDNYPYGANMAFRRDVLRRKSFDPRLGRTGTGAVRGEEMTLIRALLAEGEKGWWVPGARVRHWIPADRQSLKYLREYYYAAGRTLGLLGEGNIGRKLFGRPLWLWRQYFVAEASYWLYRLLASPERWLPNLKDASAYRGFLRAFTQQPGR
jgi:glycosyltransferase involved in cell wall biosynthesis